jgi:hypothetical protein
MKPVKKMRHLEPVEYWSCGLDIKGHFHSEKKLSRRCIARQGTPPFAEICAAKLIRNKKIITRFIEVKQMAQTGRDIGVSSALVANVLRGAMDICQSNPQGAYSPTRRMDDGRYTEQCKSPIYTTVSISLDEIRALVKIWESTKDGWWIFIDGFSDQWEHRDGPPLYRFSDKEINAMDMPE